MKISVVMPVYNSALYLKDSIKSILNQSYEDFELIIINDASEDDSKEIIYNYKDPRIKYFENKKNLGISRSINFGIKNSKGKYVARMDADDISKPNRFAVQIDYLEKYQYDIVGSWIEVIDESGNILYIKKNISNSNLLLFALATGNQFCHSSLMFNRRVFDSGYYDGKYKYSQDYELICRNSQSTKMTNIEEILVAYRVHNNAMSSNPDQLLFSKRVMISHIRKHYHDINKTDLDRYFKVVRIEKYGVVDFIFFIFVFLKLRRQFVQGQSLSRNELKVLDLFVKNKIIYLTKHLFDLKFPAAYKKAVWLKNKFRKSI